MIMEYSGMAMASKGIMMENNTSIIMIRFPLNSIFASAYPAMEQTKMPMVMVRKQTSSVFPTVLAKLYFTNIVL